MLSDLSRLAKSIKKYFFRKSEKIKRGRNKRRQLVRICGYPIPGIISVVERKLRDAGVDNNLVSRYAFLGGVNNLGFILHESCPEGQLQWVTKIALSHDIQREKIILQWHQSHVPASQAFAPELKTAGGIPGTDIEFIIIEALQRPDTITLPDVVSLYSRAGMFGDKFASQFADTCEFEIALQGGTKIRDALSLLVSRFGSDTAEQYILDYFNERKASIEQFSDEIDLVLQAMLQFYCHLKMSIQEYIGFVHGDFKKTNMMVGASGNLKLVDFQYCTIGVRAWDLAFYLSKDRRGFADSYSGLIALPAFSRNEENLVIFFYVIAVMLHIQSSDFKFKYEHFISPALRKLQTQLER